jgi:hypothetical protein
MIPGLLNLRSLCVATIAAIGACASTPVATDSASPDSVRLRVTAVSVSGDANEVLTINATLENGSAEAFQRLGCLRPQMMIDSATASGWAELPALQSAELALCFSPYYIVGAHLTQAFETSFARKSPGTPFPRGIALRARVVGPTPESGPTAPVVILTR